MDILITPPDRSESEQITQPKRTVTVLLAGSSGIPGRNILSALLALKSSEFSSINLELVVLRRPSTQNRAGEAPDGEDYNIVLVNNFSDIATLTQVISTIMPDIVISALNAEPAPDLDNYLLDAITNPAISRLEDDHPIFFINGFTLDLLHPSGATDLPASAMEKIKPKIDFAHRLQALSQLGSVEYCTVVCAAFLDYCLVKGYSGINLETKEATLFDEGENVITGCSLTFVGDAVAQVVKQHLLGSPFEQQEILNRRLRIAETEYSGRQLLDVVQKVTGAEYTVRQRTTASLLEAGSVIGYLNWNGKGASSFTTDGLQFGGGTKPTVRRRTLDEIAKTAIDNGVKAFQGIGR